MVWQALPEALRSWRLCRYKTAKSHENQSNQDNSGKTAYSRADDNSITGASLTDSGYFHNEKYLLPFSHDEVVHGKATIMQKMNGEYEGKFPQARAMYLFMMVHPGKKLNFMGNEIGQLREWDEEREQDWDLRKYPSHDSFYRYMADLNRIYLAHSALYEWDYMKNGFQWLDCHQESRCVYAIERRSETERIAAIFNFSQNPQQDYEVFLQNAGSVTPLLYSDWNKYGGETPELESVCTLNNGKLSCSLNPFSAILLKVKE